ncbi:MAG: Lrp/AsnC family transcriptional regulator [Pseudomonadota bacterium]
MDRIDEQILHALQLDGRLSNTRLAEQVGLSPSACLRRVQALENSGVIRGYKAIVDRSAVGGGMTVFVTVGLSEHGRKAARNFERALESAKEVRECHSVTGSIEYLLRVEVADLDGYKSFHDNLLGMLPNVHSITSHICLSSPKDERA